MAKLTGIVAIVRGDCLSNAALFFENPCIEYWLSLSRLAEAVVLFDGLIFLSTKEPEEIKSTVFDHQIIGKLSSLGIIKLVPFERLVNREVSIRTFDHFSAAIDEFLPQPLDKEANLELFDDVLRRFRFESFAYHGLYEAFETGPQRYYDQTTPSNKLRTIASKVFLMALAHQYNTDIIDDPLEASSATECYEKGLARNNLTALSEIISETYSSSMIPSESFLLNSDPISSVAIHKAAQKGTTFIEEILELRKKFAPYREKIGTFISLDLSKTSIGEFLKIRCRMIDEVQQLLRSDWNFQEAGISINESIDACLTDDTSVSLSVSSLLKTLVKGIKIKLVRMRARPIFQLSKELKRLPVISTALGDSFDWNPTNQECSKIAKLIEPEKTKINDQNFLSKAREDFVSFHKTLPDDIKFRI